MGTIVRWMTKLKILKTVLMNWIAAVDAAVGNKRKKSTVDADDEILVTDPEAEVGVTVTGGALYLAHHRYVEVRLRVDWIVAAVVQALNPRKVVVADVVQAVMMIRQGAADRVAVVAVARRKILVKEDEAVGDDEDAVGRYLARDLIRTTAGVKNAGTGIAKYIPMDMLDVVDLVNRNLVDITLLSSPALLVGYDESLVLVDIAPLSTPTPLVCYSESLVLLVWRSIHSDRPPALLAQGKMPNSNTKIMNLPAAI